MAGTNEKLTVAVEQYFADLHRIRSSGGATGERSYYPPLTNLLNAVGITLKPKVFCVSELAHQGAGHPDLGLYAAKQVQRGQPREGQMPEGGVVEVKAAHNDACLISERLHRYLATDSPLIAAGYHTRYHSGPMLYQLRTPLRLLRFVWSCGPTGTLSQGLETRLCREARRKSPGSLAWFPGVVARGLERGRDVSLAVDLVEATHQQHYGEGV